VNSVSSVMYVVVGVVGVVADDQCPFLELV
jgi:hypothetical protein